MGLCRPKTKIGVNVPQFNSNWCANFQRKGSKVRVKVTVAQCSGRARLVDDRISYQYWANMFAC